MFKHYSKKTIFPHRYSKFFYDYWWTHTALWKSLTDRLRIEKDVMVLITGDTGCISGDTEIRINKNKSTKKYKIKDLYLKANGLEKKTKRKPFNINDPLFIRSFNNKNIKLHKIREVLFSGKKIVYELKLVNGLSIKATPEHKIMTRDGWVELYSLKKGNLVMCDTPNSEPLNRKRIKLRDISLSVGKNHPYNIQPNHQIEVHRLIYEAKINKLEFLEYLDILLNESKKCKNLIFIDPKKYVIHHIDGNHYNNKLDNLEKMKPSEHKLRHNNYSNFSQGEPKFSEVKSITIVGEEDTYDISCEDPYHNFVANNIIIKNSGKSHFTGTLCFKHAEKEDNFILNDGTKMFLPEENFIISPEEFAYKMITKEGQVLWGDEFRRGANRRDWYSPINKAILDRKNSNRKLFNIYFLCMPFESEFDPKLAVHLHMWIWVRRGVGEVYVKRSGVKGGRGLDIQIILEREAKWLKENPKKTIVPPIIHPEYCGRIAFAKLTAGLERRYKALVQEKKATGELTDEEKIKYGIKIEKTPKQIVNESIEKIKSSEIKDRRELWNSLEEINDTDEKKLKILNFYLRLEGWDTFNKLFNKKKLEVKDIW